MRNRVPISDECEQSGQFVKCDTTVNNEFTDEKIIPEVQQKTWELRKLFNREGRVKKSFQLQNQVDKKFENFFEEGSFERVEEFQEDEFIQLIVITERKDK